MEKKIIDDLYEFIYNNQVSDKFIHELEVFIIRSRNIINKPLIFQLPNEILCMIFDYIGIYNPLAKNVCYRWKTLTKNIYPRNIFVYNSGKILDWICKDVKLWRIKDIKWQNMMEHEIKYEQSIIWLYNFHGSSIDWSVFCMIFYNSIVNKCLEVAKHLYAQSHYNKKLKISLKLIKRAIYNNDIKTFEWLHNISNKQFKKEKIVVEFINKHQLVFDN